MVIYQKNQKNLEELIKEAKSYLDKVSKLHEKNPDLYKPNKAECGNVPVTYCQLIYSKSE